MTDEEALAMYPALKEFVDAVNDRDRDLVIECFKYTPPETLAILAAGWIGDLLNERDEKPKRMTGREVTEAMYRLNAKLAKAKSDLGEAREAQRSQAAMIARLKTEVRERGGVPA